MKKLVVSVDDVAVLRFKMSDSDYDPVQYALLAEYAGAQGIAATLTDKPFGIQERDALLIRKMNKTFFNLHIPPEPQIVKQALSIKPDMVTFVDISRTDGIELMPLSSMNLAEVVSQLMPDLAANNISVAVFALPEMNVLKQLTRVKVDYVQFDATEVTMAADSNEEMVAFDKLGSASMAAAKLGIGVNTSGGIDYNHLPGLSGILRVEDIIVGSSIVKRAMLVGLEKAVAEARQQILAYKRD